MLEFLRDNMCKAIHTLKGNGKITESNIANTTKEIRRTLIQSDVNYKLAKEITDKIKQESIGKNVITSLRPSELFTKIVYDNLVSMMSCGDNRIILQAGLTKIMLVGLQGAGKTTLAVKLAKFLKTSYNRNPLLIACDVYRPAAIEQLRVLGQQSSVDVFAIDGEMDVCRIITGGVESVKSTTHDVVIIDTAGRQTVDIGKMDEIKRINDMFSIDESLLVLDSMIGQKSVDVAKVFNETINITGVVLTKLDSDTKGGVALSVIATIHKPIKLISIGEKVDDIDLFYPDRITQRILGNGDILSLVEKVEKSYANIDGQSLDDKLKHGILDYTDIINVFDMLGKIGGASKVFDLLPGMPKVDTKLKETEENVNKFRSIINSMTPSERKDKHRFDMSRKMRIAMGSGTSIDDVNRLIKVHGNMSNMLKKVNGKSFRECLKMNPMFNKFGNGGDFFDV